MRFSGKVLGLLTQKEQFFFLIFQTPTHRVIDLQPCVNFLTSQLNVSLKAAFSKTLFP